MNLRKVAESIGVHCAQPPIRRRQTVYGFAAGVLAALAFASVATAAPVTYTNLAAFNGALSSATTTVNFDSTSAGTTISSGGSVGGLGFTYFLGSGVLLAVTDGTSFGASSSAVATSTTSEANFLGTNDLDHLQDGDTLTLSFAAGGGIGLYILTQDPMQDGDVTLTAGGATASLVAAAVEQTLGDGSSVYFLGVLDGAGSISSAVLDYPNDGEAEFLFNVDDVILVPEPGQWMMLLPGIASLAGLSRLRGRRSNCRETGESADSRKRSEDV